jgi:hypothetical protein
MTTWLYNTNLKTGAWVYSKFKIWLQMSIRNWEDTTINWDKWVDM